MLKKTVNNNSQKKRDINDRLRYIQNYVNKGRIHSNAKESLTMIFNHRSPLKRNLRTLGLIGKESKKTNVSNIMKCNINQELFVSCSYMSLISKFNMLLNMLKKCLNSVPNNINTFQEEKSIEENSKESDTISDQNHSSITKSLAKSILKKDLN